MFSFVRKKDASRADVILHPQRMAVIRALAGRPQTAKDLLGAIPDVSQATLYRHLTLLLESGIIRVDSERRSRGAVERTYALAGDAIVSGADLAEATREDHFRYFATFASGLMGRYSDYLGRADIDLERDGIGFREHVLQLTDGELREMLVELRAVIEARAGNAPRADRVARLIATVTMPFDQQKAEDDDDRADD
jgi:DNA-binding transcriptional ArsR family regulator